MFSVAKEFIKLNIISSFLSANGLNEVWVILHNKDKKCHRISDLVFMEKILPEYDRLRGRDQKAFKFILNLTRGC